MAAAEAAAALPALPAAAVSGYKTRLFDLIKQLLVYKTVCCFII